MRVAEQEIKQRVVQELEKLPPEKLGEVLDFVVFLKKRTTWKRHISRSPFYPPRILTGLWA